MEEMEHHFNVYIAKDYGVHSAIILNNLEHWIAYNKANNKNFYEGNYWTYNSKKAFAELFPYLNARQIDYALKKLIDDEIVITGNFNKVAYDRTLWYAITKKGYSILQNCEMDNTNLEVGINDNVQPIPNINTNNNITNNNTGNKQEERKEEPKKSSSKKQTNYDQIIADNIFDDQLKETLYEFIKMRTMIKKPLTDFALTKMINKLEKLSKNSIGDAVKILEQSIMNNWQDIYALKVEKQQANKSNQSSGNIFLDIVNDEEGGF